MVFKKGDRVEIVATHERGTIESVEKGLLDIDGKKKILYTIRLDGGKLAGWHGEFFHIAGGDYKERVLKKIRR